MISLGNSAGATDGCGDGEYKNNCTAQILLHVNWECTQASKRWVVKDCTEEHGKGTHFDPRSPLHLFLSPACSVCAAGAQLPAALLSPCLLLAGAAALELVEVCQLTSWSPDLHLAAEKQHQGQALWCTAMGTAVLVAQWLQQQGSRTCPHQHSCTNAANGSRRGWHRGAARTTLGWKMHFWISLYD